MSDAVKAAEQEPAPEHEEVEVQAPQVVERPAKPQIPSGYVPAAEVGKERKKAADFEKRCTDLQALLAEKEALETKRKYLRESLKELGDSWTIENQGDLEELADAIKFDDTVKDKITKLVNSAKRAKSTAPHIPMLGTVNRDQQAAATTTTEPSKYPMHDKYRARLDK